MPVGAARAETARFAVSKRMAKSCITVYIFSGCSWKGKCRLDGFPNKERVWMKPPKKIGGEKTECREHE
jgi:hypothetical protein